MKIIIIKKNDNHENQKIKEIYARIMKIIKILQNHWIRNKHHGNIRNPYENYENRENHRNP